MTARLWHRILTDYQEDARLSILRAERGGSPRGEQITVREIRGIQSFEGQNVWVGLNPMREVSWGRGGEEDVVEVRALWVDFDIGDGKMPHEQACRASIEALSNILGAEPAYVTFTGHGFQPVWSLVPDSDVKAWLAIKPRWAKLVRSVARAHGGQGVDGAFDLARVLRVPGTVNWKYPDSPVQTDIEWVGGKLLTRQDVEAALDAYSFLGSGGAGASAVPAKRPPRSCPYVTAMVQGWAKDVPDRRHPWALSQAVRLEAAILLGCVSEDDELRARRALVDGLRRLTSGEARESAEEEMSRIWPFANRVAAMKSPEELRAELGGHTHGTGESLGKPRLDVTNPALAAETVRAELGRGPTSGVFVRNGALVFTRHVTEDGYEPLNGSPNAQDSEYQVRLLDPVRLSAEMDHRYRVVKYSKGRGGPECPALFPAEVARRHVAAPENLPHVRQLTAVSRAPFVRPDWTIVTQPGYDPSTGVLYIPRGAPVEVPRIPTAAQVTAARELLLLMLNDFPFNSPDDRINYLAALIWLVTVQTHGDACPALIINAHDSGSGKTLLAHILRVLFDGALRSEWPTGKEEQEKEIAAVLSATTGGVVVYDNIRGTLNSGVLEGVLTQRHTSMRRLGKNDDRVALNNDRLFVLTGNNVSIAGDLRRRVVWSRIDPGMPHPERRTEFKIEGPLLDWVEEHRNEILAAILTLVANWVAQGRPMPRTRTDSFASTIDVAQGVLGAAGIDGTVAAPSTEPLGGLNEEDEWAEWFEALYKHFQGQAFTAAELAKVLEQGREDYGDERKRELWNTAPSDVTSRFRKTGGYSAGGSISPRTLGMFLSNRNGRYFGDHAVVMIPDGRKGNKYQIREYEGEWSGA